MEVAVSNTTQKEDLSYSYIAAVCATAGIDFERVNHDHDSTDAILKQTVKLPDGSHFIAEMRVQLKSTSSSNLLQERQNSITYRLKAKNYNDLIKKGSSPAFLMLLVLPTDQNEWIHWTIDELAIRKCMYWLHIPDDSEQVNTGSKSVIIQKSQVVNVDSLNELFQKIAREEL